MAVPKHGEYVGIVIQFSGTGKEMLLEKDVGDPRGSVLWNNLVNRMPILVFKLKGKLEVFVLTPTVNSGI